MDSLVDKIATEFDRAWTNGRPRIEDYLGGVEQSKREDLFKELLRIELSRIEQGKRKGNVTTARKEDYARRFPSFSDTVADVFGSRQTHGFGSNEAEHSTTEFPDLSPNFTVKSIIGRGGFGSVYLAWDERLKRQVALKILHRADDPEIKIRFLEEARSSAGLRHDNICRVFDVVDASGRQIIVMEYIEGQLLSKIQGDVAPRAAAEMVFELADGVTHAHERGVLHRDIKPANVLLKIESNGRQRPILTDFGLAKRRQPDREGELTVDNMVLGTPSYMSPEQADGRTKDVDERSDLYGLGAVLYFLLCGKPPFEGDSVSHVLDRVRSEDVVLPSKVSSGISRDLETICLKALSKSPSQRYQNAAEFRDDLGRFLQGEAIHARRTPFVERVYRRVSRHPWKFATVATLIIVAFLVPWLVSRSADSHRTADLVTQINTCFSDDDWSPAKLTKVEELLEQLASYDQARSEQLGEELYKKYSRSVVAKNLQHGSLDREAEARVMAAIRWLTGRNAQHAEELRERLDERKRHWDEYISLNSEGGRLKLDETNVVSDGTILRTSEAIAGDIRVHAILAGAPFEDAVDLLVDDFLLNAGGEEGYVFRLRNGPAANQSSAEIWRGQELLRFETIPAVTGDIDLIAIKEGHYLTFQVEANPPLTFQDVFSPSAQSVNVHVGIRVPTNCSVTSFRVFRRSFPHEPSPLETADRQFFANDINGALEQYEAAEIAAGDSPVASEARFRQAICLRRLERHGEAIDLLHQLLDDEAAPWSLLAGCVLCDLYVNSKESDLDKANAVIGLLKARFNREEVTRFVPAEMPRRVFRQRRWQSESGWLVLGNQHRMKRLEQACEIDSFFDIFDRTALRTNWSYFRSLRIAGDNESALKIADEVTENLPSPTTDSQHIWYPLIEERSWILREEGRIKQAIVELERFITSCKSADMDHTPLLVERGRLRLLLGQQDQALADLWDVLNTAGKEHKVEYRFVSAASLLLGCVLDDEGDQEGAKDAWKAGSPDVFFAEDGWLEQWIASSGTIGLLQGMMLKSLSTGFSDEEAGQIRDVFVQKMMRSKNRFLPQIVRFALPEFTDAKMAAFLNSLCRTERGMDSARAFAFQDRPFREVLKQGLSAGMATAIRETAVFGEFQANSDQNELLWNACRLGFESAIKGDVGLSEALPAVLLFNGLSAFGWQSLSARLEMSDPELKRLTAYFFGLRYRKLKRDQEAAKFFQDAIAGAESDSLRFRLAQKELDEIAASQSKPATD